MIISVDWVSDYCAIKDLSPDEIYTRFTLGTAEVEEVKTSGDHLKLMSVGHIKSIRKHPEADKLNLVTVDLGNKTIEVVCGASNVREDLKIAYAPVGTTLPIGLTLEPKKIRGVLSEGMICSLEELGMAESSEGILELPDSAQTGMSMLEYFDEKQDVLLDVDNKSLTHRPDLWGIYGHAREFATLFKKELKNPFTDDWAKNLKAKFTSDPSPISPKCEGDSACLAYFGLSVDGVTVGESPKWMQARLNAVGLRPINSIVDISNYVMYELGIPNHIFDRDCIEDNTLKIHALSSDQKFTTLDEVERDLKSGDTVISDSKKPLVIGGLMGGLSSGVTEKTTKVFIEVANWKAAEVRKTSTRLGLRTDSSQRYEKSLDSQLCERTVLRILELLLELNPGAKVVGKLEYDGLPLNEYRPLVLSTSVEKINLRLGKEVEKSEVIRIFKDLGFGVNESGAKLDITVPSYRATKDVECEADLIEEIGRVVGFDNITPVSPEWGITPARLTHTQKLHRKIKDFMVYQGSSLEVYTKPLIGEAALKKAMWNELNEELILVNSLSIEHDRMRPSLIPSVLESLSLNAKNADEFKLFELGRSYSKGKKEFREESSQLIMAFYSKESSPFIDVVNTLEGLMRNLGVSYDLGDKVEKFPNPALPYDWKGCHPHEYQTLRIMGKPQGGVVSVHPILLKGYKIKGKVTLAVVDFTLLEQRPLKQKFKYQPLPKFPSSSFDCTVVADTRTPVSEVLAALKGVKYKELKETKVVGIYPLSDGQKSVTLRSLFADAEKTLSGDFLKEAEAKVVKCLEEKGFPLKA